jgi:hypothetical protein
MAVALPSLLLESPDDTVVSSDAEAMVLFCWLLVRWRC